MCSDIGAKCFDIVYYFRSEEGTTEPIKGSKKKLLRVVSFSAFPTVKVMDIRVINHFWANFSKVHYWEILNIAE